MADRYKQSWSVGITCYNEEETVGQVVQRTQEVLELIAAESEIIIVDDASEDQSTTKIRQLSKEYNNVSPIFHDENLGIGRSIRDIYFNAQYENVTFIPGDAQFDPHELVPFAHVEEHTYVSFYRKENEVYSNYRAILSFLNKLINKYLIGLELKDVNWVNVFKTKSLQELDLQIKSSIVVSEICAKLNVLGYEPVEVISTYHPRVAGESKGASWSNIIDVVPEILSLIISVWRFNRKIKKQKS